MTSLGWIPGAVCRLSQGPRAERDDSSCRAGDASAAVVQGICAVRIGDLNTRPPTLSVEGSVYIDSPNVQDSTPGRLEG
jgi:hypothetical protein